MTDFFLKWRFFWNDVFFWICSFPCFPIITNLPKPSFTLEWSVESTGPFNPEILSRTGTRGCSMAFRQRYARSLLFQQNKHVRLWTPTSGRQKIQRQHVVQSSRQIKIMLRGPFLSTFRSMFARSKTKNFWCEFFRKPTDRLFWFHVAWIVKMGAKWLSVFAEK